MTNFSQLHIFFKGSMVKHRDSYKGPVSEEENEAIDKAVKIGYMYISPFVIILGIFGCLANLLTLNHKQFQGRFFTYLKALAVADLIFLCFVMSSVVHTLDDLKREDSEDYIQLVYETRFEDGLVNGFLAASVFITVCLNLDRFYAICRPSFYREHRSHDPSCSNKPLVEILGAFFCGLTINAPRLFAQRVELAFCEYETPTGQTNTPAPPDNDTVCTCRESSETEITCYYDEEEVVNITSTLMWKTYIVLSELAIRILPSILLVALNLAMINDFNVSVRRRQKLIASVFTISTSSIFGEETLSESVGSPSSGQIFMSDLFRSLSDPNEGERKKKKSKLEIADAKNTKDKDKSEPDLVSLTRRLSQQRPSEFSPDVPKLMNKLRNPDARRKSLTMSGKEKNVIITLVIISSLFVICNIPQSIMRIMLTFGDFNGRLGFEIFRICANLLEIFNCSFNFYSYCLVNSEIRRRIKDMWLWLWEEMAKSKRDVIKLTQKRENNKRDSVDSQQMFQQMFPEIFKKSERQKNNT